MNIGNMLFLIEFLASFGLVLAFCFWQLHSLNKLDREEAAQKKAAEECSDKA